MLYRKTKQIVATIVLDLLCTVFAVTLASWVRLRIPIGRTLHVQYFEANLGTIYLETVLLYLLVFTLFSIHDPKRTYRAVNEFQILVWASTIAALALTGLVYFTARDTSRLFLAYFFGFHLVLVASWRAVERLIRQGKNVKGQDLRKVLLMGGGESAFHSLQQLDDLAWAGVHLVGYLTDRDPIPSINNNINQLGSLGEAEKIIQAYQVDDVLVAMPAESYNSIQQIITKIMDKPCNIWVVPDYFILLLSGSRMENLGGVPMISLKSPSLTGYHRVIKRILDLVLGIIWMVPALPVMALITLAIKLDSPGAAIFKQERVGENGQLFFIYKFRSMVIDADKRLNEVTHRNKDGELIHKTADDPRITRVGRFLRRTSLDELPQLFNVLLGEMSLVGPRPELPILVEQYEPWQHKRFATPSGITGWWQVNGRSDKPMHLHTEDDLYYIQNYSLLLDLQILLKTVWVVLLGKGSY